MEIYPSGERAKINSDPISGFGDIRIDLDQIGMRTNFEVKLPRSAGVCRLTSTIHLDTIWRRLSGSGNLVAEMDKLCAPELGYTMLSRLFFKKIFS